MRVINVFFLIVMALGLISSCKKSEDFFVISGRLIDQKQNIQLEGVKVELWAQKIKSGIYSAHYDNYGSQITNSKGEFYFELENQTYASVKLSFSLENYFGWEYEIDGEVLKNDFLHDETYEMRAKAWIHFFIKNDNPYDDQDYFDFRIMNGLNTCENCCTGETLKFYGTQVDEDFICQMTGHEDVSIRWTSRKATIQTGDIDLIFLPAFDTTKVEFRF